MNQKDAFNDLAQIRNLRKYEVIDKLQEEKRNWSNKGKYYIEKSLLQKLVKEVDNPLNYGKDLNVCIILEDTMVSGDSFIDVYDLINTMKLAGIEIEIKKCNEFNNSIEVNAKIDVSKVNLQNGQSTFGDISCIHDLTSEFLVQKDENWFLKKLAGYWNYKKTDEGIKETENLIVLYFFDIITNRWSGNLVLDELSNPNSEITTDFLDIDEFLNNEFFDLDKIFEKLKFLLSDTGFVMEVNHFSLNGKNLFNIGIKEKDYILDKENITKLISETRILQK